MSQILRPLPAIVRFCLVFLLSAHLSPQQTGETPSQAGSGKIVVAVNAVLVPVVVRDSQGHSVGNLNKEDFRVFDKNKPQVISGFSIQRRTELESYRASAAPAPNSPGATQPPAVVPERFVVFLFDDMHLNGGDLTQIQKVASKMVGGSLSESDLAAVVSISGISSGLTSDHAKLQDAIMKLKVQNLYRNVERSCPKIDYYDADRIQNKRDLMALDTAIESTMTCCDCARETARTYVQEAAGRALQIGDQDVRVTLGSIGEIVRKMGAMPGQRTLILVSPGFLTITAEAMAEKSHILDMAAQSNVTISAVDARGLYTTILEADDRTGGTTRTTRAKAQSRGESMLLDEDIMGELAQGTGGTYFHNSNDLEGGLQTLTAVPEYVYLIELSLQNVKQDGAYHLLKVKLDRDGFKLQARRGYFAPKAEKSKNAK
jgi:VWFA-related protein